MIPTPIKRLWKKVRARLGPRPDQIYSLRPPLPLPAGVSEQELRANLMSVRPADASPAEMQRYCSEDFRRFVYTYGLARDCTGTALELGANPYFTTMLLRQFT